MRAVLKPQSSPSLGLLPNGADWPPSGEQHEQVRHPNGGLQRDRKRIANCSGFEGEESLVGAQYPVRQEGRYIMVRS